MKAIIVPRAFDCEPAWEMRTYRLGSYIDDALPLWIPVGSMFQRAELRDVGNVVPTWQWFLWYRVRLNATTESRRVFNTYTDGMPIPRCCEWLGTGLCPMPPDRAWLHLFEFPAGTDVQGESEYEGSSLAQPAEVTPQRERFQRVSEAWRQGGVRLDGGLGHE